MKRTDVGVLTDSVLKNCKIQKENWFSAFAEFGLPVPACSARLSQRCRWRCLFHLARTILLALPTKPLGRWLIHLFSNACLAEPGRRNARGWKQSSRFLDFPFSSPLGEFRCNCSEEFATSAAAFCRLRAQKLTQLQLKWRFPIEILHFLGFKMQIAAGFGQIQLGMWELRFQSDSIKWESGMRGSVSVSAAGCGTKGRQ